MALLSSSVSPNPLSLHIFTPKSTTKTPRLFSPSLASLSPPPPPSSSNSSASASQEPTSATTTENFTVFGKGSSKAPEFPYNYSYTDLNGNPVVRFVQSTESTIERVIFDFRFLALFAIGGSLAGSLLCFLNGCVYIFDAYKVYWTSCVKGIHSGKMVLRLVEAIDVYLAGTVMLIFAMGLYGLFISNVPPDVPPGIDRALEGSSLFGMFALKVLSILVFLFSGWCLGINNGMEVQERPQWMKISSLDELKTKVGHVIVMILLVKMFERSKMVSIATGLDLLSYSVCIFLSSASLYVLHNLHKPESH